MYMVEEELCNGCGICVSFCPAGAIRVMNDIAEIDWERCNDCGSCFDACLRNAIFELNEPRRIASAARHVSVKEGARSPLEQASGPPATIARGKPGTVLVAAFPIILKLAGALADYLSSRSGKGPVTCRGSAAAGRGKGGAGGRGKHRYRGF